MYTLSWDKSIRDRIIEIGTYVRNYYGITEGEDAWEICGGECNIWSSHFFALCSKEGIEDARMVYGTYTWEYGQTPHWWIEVGPYIVDLTVNQFESIQPLGWLRRKGDSRYIEKWDA